MPNPEEMWKRFIEHLNEVDPLTFVSSKGRQGAPCNAAHASFLGSIAKYEKLFIEANASASVDPNQE